MAYKNSQAELPGVAVASQKSPNIRIRISLIFHNILDFDFLKFLEIHYQKSNRNRNKFFQNINLRS